MTYLTPRQVEARRILISEATIRADLLFDDENGVDCFPKQVIWDTLRDIGYEGNLAHLTFSKPLFSPQWKYLVHVLLHCLSPKSTSWEQFGTNIASALVGLATNQKFNFSLMILTGMLGHISNGPLFSMYPRITPLTPSMLEVVTALAAEEEQSTSPHSRAASYARDAQGTPTQSAAHSRSAAHSQRTASFHGTVNSQGTAEIQRTADFQGTAEPHDAASIPKSPNDYTPTDASQTSGGDEGLLDIYALNREVRRLKKQTLSQAKQIIKLKAKLKKLSKFVAPVVKHHALWVENQNLKKQKRRRKKHKKKVSSVKLGRNKDEGTCSEEHNVQEVDTNTSFFDDTAESKMLLTPKWKEKVMGLKKLILRRKKLLMTLNFEDEAGPSSPLRPIQVMDSEEQHNAAEVLVSISRPRGLSIPGPTQTQPQQPTQGQGYKNLQKLKYPQMKELYDKVQASIKDSFKDFIPMDSEKEREMLKERDAKRLLRKRKATISEEQPSKKPKLKQKQLIAQNYLSHYFDTFGSFLWTTAMVTILKHLLLIAQKEEAGIQLQAEEFDLMAAAADLDEIEEVNANCILMANLQQASTSAKAALFDKVSEPVDTTKERCTNTKVANQSPRRKPSLQACYSNLFYGASLGCSKQDRNLKLPINFVWNFLGTVRFGNDHIAAILGYGDLQWGNILISRFRGCFSEGTLVSSETLEGVLTC
ncbi:hypothetical protein Tco_1101879 [Tanacetum coccineum]